MEEEREFWIGILIEEIENLRLQEIKNVLAFIRA